MLLPPPGRNVGDSGAKQVLLPPRERIIDKSGAEWCFLPPFLLTCAVMIGLPFKGDDLGKGVGGVED